MSFVLDKKSELLLDIYRAVNKTVNNEFPLQKANTTLTLSRLQERENSNLNSAVIKEALKLVQQYIADSYEHHDLLCSSLSKLSGEEIRLESQASLAGKNKKKEYEDLQAALATINEKQDARKTNGVYYTPADVVRFITANCIRATYGLIDSDNLSYIDFTGIPVCEFCLEKTVFEPTCGAGEFLLAVLNIKLNLWESAGYTFSADQLRQIVGTFHGNDINSESTTITKIRLFLAVLKKCGPELACSMVDAINASFTTYDFVNPPEQFDSKFDIIIGNPPYVEDSKYGALNDKYGNIYCNILSNASKHLTENGVIGFIIPLSYVSTPRMKKIRDKLFSVLPKQYILSYADRPDCLFTSVHQKLCILIGCSGNKKVAYTSNYHYWYKEERGKLFERTPVIENSYFRDDCILKFGTVNDINIYKKVMDPEHCTSVYATSRTGNEYVYVNRRETFWIKAYRTPVIHPEYKVFSYETAGEADYCYCLVNSSLFWWYWICTSDCWHVSKELNGFMAPNINDYETAIALTQSLARKLEETKVYVGTKQTEYEYKHNACVDEIHAIDDYINGLYRLTDEESEYIKSFAYRYRISGGAKKDESR